MNPDSFIEKSGASAETSGITRRRVLGSAAKIAALAAVSSFLPPNLRRVLAQTPPQHGSLSDIKHVVLLMQ